MVLVDNILSREREREDYCQREVYFLIACYDTKEIITKNFNDKNFLIKFIGLSLSLLKVLIIVLNWFVAIYDISDNFFCH